MARELVGLAIQAKATRIRESNKRKWEDHQRNDNNRNNNTHHHQQNKRQETAKAYVAALTEGKGYTRNLPLCNKYRLHHHSLCPPKCGTLQEQLSKEKRSIEFGARRRAYVMRTEDPQQNPNVVTGEKPEKDMRFLLSIKTDEKKLKDILIVHDFLKVFPDYSSGLPPVYEIEFRIDLIPITSPLVRSLYQLAHFEMLELAN
nr:reverse transcriptase domain-containing protein [Tanacetum cinerariifolium]